MQGNNIKKYRCDIFLNHFNSHFHQGKPCQICQFNCNILTFCTKEIGWRTLSLDLSILALFTTFTFNHSLQWYQLVDDTTKIESSQKKCNKKVMTVICWEWCWMSSFCCIVQDCRLITFKTIELWNSSRFQMARISSDHKTISPIKILWMHKNQKT